MKKIEEKKMALEKEIERLEKRIKSLYDRDAHATIIEAREKELNDLQDDLDDLIDGIDTDTIPELVPAPAPKKRGPGRPKGATAKASSIVTKSASPSSDDLAPTGIYGEYVFTADRDESGHHKTAKSGKSVSYVSATPTPIAGNGGLYLKISATGKKPVGSFKVTITPVK